jgi:hypothetical protein
MIKFETLGQHDLIGPKHCSVSVQRLNEIGMSLDQAKRLIDTVFCCCSDKIVQIRQRASNPDEYQFWFTSDKQADMVRSAFLGYRIAYDSIPETSYR